MGVVVAQVDPGVMSPRSNMVTSSATSRTVAVSGVLVGAALGRDAGGEGADGLQVGGDGGGKESKQSAGERGRGGGGGGLKPRTRREGTRTSPSPPACSAVPRS